MLRGEGDLDDVDVVEADDDASDAALNADNVETCRGDGRGYIAGFDGEGIEGIEGIEDTTGPVAALFAFFCMRQ